MVETSKVWRSSLPRKLSRRIHLRYTLLSARHTQTGVAQNTHIHTHNTDVARRTLIIWQPIQSELPSVVAAVVLPRENRKPQCDM